MSEEPTTSLFTPCCEGRFVGRPNRFIALVEVHHGNEKRIERCHCPNPGRLMELLFPGTRVWLEKNLNPGKTAYTLAAVEHRGMVVPLYSARANQAAAELVLPRWYPETPIQHPEFTPHRGGSRFDFLLTTPLVPDPSGVRHQNQSHLGSGPSGVRPQRGLTPSQGRLIEVKACTLAEYGTAMFPDAPSPRALRHLTEMAHLIIENPHLHGTFLFMIMHPNAEDMIPALHTDPDFALGLKSILEETEASAPGRLEARAVTLEAHENGQVRLGREVPLNLAPLHPDLRDSGVYWVVLQLESKETITIGALGTFTFPAGFYIYTGSARGGLKARLQRHQRLRKNFHWHIDYLRARCKVIKTLEIRTQENLECTLAQAAAETADCGGPHAPWKGFGSSDCACPTHLAWYRENPLHNRAVVEKLLWFRHRGWRGD